MSGRYLRSAWERAVAISGYSLKDRSDTSIRLLGLSYQAGSSNGHYKLIAFDLSDLWLRCSDQYKTQLTRLAIGIILGQWQRTATERTNYLTIWVVPNAIFVSLINSIQKLAPVPCVSPSSTIRYPCPHSRHRVLISNNLKSSVRISSRFVAKDSSP